MHFQGQYLILPMRLLAYCRGLVSKGKMVKDGVSGVSQLPSAGVHKQAHNPTLSYDVRYILF